MIDNNNTSFLVLFKYLLRKINHRLKPFRNKSIRRFAQVAGFGGPGGGGEESARGKSAIDASKYRFPGDRFLEMNDGEEKNRRTRLVL